MLLVGFVLLILGIIFLYWFDKRRGERAWEKYKAEARARGDKLYLSEYEHERPAIPDEENYAAAPIFRLVGERRIRAGDAQNSSDTAPADANPREPAAWVGSPSGESDPLLLYQEAFVREKWIATKSDSPAVDILTALKRCEPALASIREASVRPKSQWPLAVDELETNRLYCGVPLLQASTDFLLRARALLALQRPDDALNEMRYALRAARSLDDEPGIRGLVFQLNI
jgi:hypothetical protein